MKQQELDSLMQDSAQNAIESTQMEFDLVLDKTPESLSKVDDVLLAYIERYQDSALEDQAVFTLCNIYGAYIGEVFRATRGGQWRYDVSDEKAPYVLLDYAGQSYAFAGICYQRLVNDSSVSVKAYFDQAMENSE